MKFMGHFFTLVRHEVRLLFIAPSTYVASVLFILLMGFIYWATLRSMTLIPQDTSSISKYFSLFWLPIFFTVPLLTMRSIAEERNQIVVRYSSMLVRLEQRNKTTMFLVHTEKGK